MVYIRINSLNMKILITFCILFLYSGVLLSQAQCQYTVSGIVFIDDEGDGVSTSNSVISGATVQLFTSAGVLVSTTTSSVSGQYSFSVAPGSYYVGFAPGGSYIKTFKDIGPNDQIDSDIGVANGANSTDDFTVLNTNIYHVDAGFYKNATVDGVLRVEGKISGDVIPIDGVACEIGLPAYPIDQAINGLIIRIYRNHFGVWTLWASTTTSDWIFPDGHPLHDLSKPNHQHNGEFRLTVPPGEYILYTPDYNLLPEIFSAQLQNMNKSGIAELYDYDNTGESNALIGVASGYTATTPKFQLSSNETFMDYSFGFIGQDASVSTLDCPGITFTPSAFTAGTAYTGIMEVDYVGGNGQAYVPALSIFSTEVSGLTAVLQAGSLNSGAGTITYNITGTPANQGNATFSFGFDEYSCIAKTVVSPAACAPAVAIPTGTTTYNSCSGQTVNMSVSLPGGSTVAWYDNPNATGSILSTSNPYSVAPTSTTRYYAFSNNGTCKSTSALAVLVNINNPSQAYGTSSYNICLGDTVNLTMTIPGGSTIAWYNNAGATGATLSTSNPFSVSPSADKTYYAFSSASGCLSLQSYAVDVFVKSVQTPTTTTNSYQICPGDTADMSVSIGACDTLRWFNNVGGLGSPISLSNPYGVSPPDTTIYYAFAYDGVCTSQNGLPITVNVIPNTIPNGATSYNACVGQSISMSVSNIPLGSSVEWYTDSTGMGSPVYIGNPYVISPTTDTTYYVFTNNGICALTSPLTITVSIDSSLVAPSGVNADTICAGQSVAISVSLPVGTGIEWYDNASGSGIPLSTSNPFVVFPNTDTAFYAFTTNGSCRSTGHFTMDIGVLSTPTTPTGSSLYSVCPGDSVSLTLAVGPGASIEWYDNPMGLGSPISVSNPWVIYPTSDTAIYAFASNGLCISPDSLEIDITLLTQPSSPNGDSLYLVCEGDTITLTVNVPGGSNVEWYNNSMGTGTPVYVGNPLMISSAQDTVLYVFSNSMSGCLSDTSFRVEVNAVNVPLVPSGNNQYDVCIGDSVSLMVNAAPGEQVDWYDNPSGLGGPVFTGNPLGLALTHDTIYYVFSNNSICSSGSALAVNVLVHALPDISLDYEDSLCENQPIVFTSLTSSGGGVLWSTGATTSSIELNSNNIPDTIWVETQTAFGCEDSAMLLNVNPNIFDNPLADFDTLFAVYISGTIPFVDSSSSDVVLWHWDFGDGVISTEQNPLHTYETAGEYTVQLIVQNEFGCFDTTFMPINIDENIKVPNVFSPNGDGYNDNFIIPISGIKDPKLVIYNRWGLKLFESSGAYLSWDGRTQAGSNVPHGTYYYIVYGQGVEKYELTGVVTLVR